MHSHRQAFGAAFGMWVLFLVGGLGMAGEYAQHATIEVPRLDKIAVDGNPADWGAGGFRVRILTPHKGAMHPAKELDAEFRAAWDDRGLLLLVRAAAQVWNESPDGYDFYNGDSVQVFVSDKERGTIETVISAGMAANQPDIRIQTTDGRTGKGLAKVVVSAARTKGDGGYFMEILLPWSNFGIAPKIGDEFGFMLAVNHSETGRDRYSPRWWTADGHRSGRGLRLSDKPSPEVNAVVASVDYELFRKTNIRVTAAAEMNGRAATVRAFDKAQAGDGAREVGAAVLTPDGTRASALITAPMPPRGRPFGEMTVLVDGKPLAAFTPPDADAERARALMAMELKFTPFVFSEKTCPPCAFADADLAQAILGPYSIRTTFYDRDYNPVTTAEKPGRYGAVIVVAPEDGRPFRRLRTLFRTPAPVDLRNLKPGDPLPAEAGILPQVATAQAASLGRALRGQGRRDTGADARLAAALAGLYETPPDAPPATVYDDAGAKDRAWWVGLKRKLYGLDKEFPVALKRPETMNPPAPVLREGDVAQAGIKLEAVAGVNAVCEAWAKDSDEAFSVCLARNGIIFFHKAYGTRGGRPMTLEDKSGIASTTKAMGGALMMMLVDQGLVDLDAPVEKYVPALRGVPSKKPITIRRLYTHTAGYAADAYLRDELNDLEEVAAAEFPFLDVGGEFNYETTGYTLAGKIIENVTGESIPQFYKRHLVGPLGAGMDAANMGAGVQSTALDVAKFGQMLLNRGAYGDQRFFSAETFQKMLPRPLTDLLGPDTKEKWGIGLRQYSIEGVGANIYGHNAASETILRVDLDHQLVIVMCRNRAGKNFAKYVPQFLQAVAECVGK